MGILTKMLSPENPSAPLWPESWLHEGGGLGHEAGIHLNELNSRSAGGVLACVRVISEALAAYPKNICRDAANGSRIVKEHPQYGLIHGSPNPQMTNLIFWIGVISQTCIWGNGYAELRRDGRQMVREMWPLPSAKVRPIRDEYGLRYMTTVGVGPDTPNVVNGERVILPQNILHFPFLSYDGIQGYSPVQLRRQGLALNMAAERFGSMYFGRGVRPSGSIETPPGMTLKPEQRQNLKQSVQESNSGANALGVMLLELGLSFKPFEISNTDAQFLATRLYQLEDIARDYRVPGHMIGILERATHSNAEQLALDFNTYTMLFWVQMVEQELDRKIFAGTPFYTKCDMDVFLRGDFATRMAGYKLMRDDGVLSADDINAKEGWPLIGDAAGGNIRIVPMNMVSLEAMKKQEDEPDAGSGGAGGLDGGTDGGDPDSDEDGDGQAASAEVKRRYALSFTRLFSDATSRTVNREKRDLAFVQRTWMPTLLTMAESLAALGSKGELKPEDHVFLADYTGAIAHRCGKWQKERAAEITTAEFNRAYTALSERS